MVRAPIQVFYVITQSVLRMMVFESRIPSDFHSVADVIILFTSQRSRHLKQQLIDEVRNLRPSLSDFLGPEQTRHRVGSSRQGFHKTISVSGEEPTKVSSRGVQGQRPEKVPEAVERLSRGRQSPAVNKVPGP